MRAFVLLAVLWATTAAAQSPPIEAIIIGVPKTQVSFYADSKLGNEITNRCDELEKFFPKDRVHVTKLCDEVKTKTDNVRNTLRAYFRSKEPMRRATLVFILTHGEYDQERQDLRLLMSDTKDSTKAEALLLGEELVPMLISAPNSISLAFIDACYSSKVPNLSLALSAIAAKAGKNNHLGLMTSASADATKVLFTEALIETLNQPDCPCDSERFLQSIITRMKNMRIDVPNSTWLVRPDGPVCVKRFLSKDKPLLSIWRDPEAGVNIEFQNQETKKTTVVPSERDFSMPYLEAVDRGNYRIVARDLANPSEEKQPDKCYLTSGSDPPCIYEYPHTKESAILLKNMGPVYRVEYAFGYDEDELDFISSSAALICGRPLRIKQGFGAQPGGHLCNEEPANAVLDSEPQLKRVIEEYRSGTKVLYASFVDQFAGTKAGPFLKTGFSKLSTGNGQGAEDLEQAATLMRHSGLPSDRWTWAVPENLRKAAQAILENDTTGASLSYLDSGIKQFNRECNGIPRCPSIPPPLNP